VGEDGGGKKMTAFPHTLVFLPGIGADHRMYKFQTEAFPNSYAVDWIDPLPKETLEQYAVRLAESIRVELQKRPSAPIVVCGLSLGGMVAPYIARELNADGCILFSTVRKPKEFPRYAYFDWLLMSLCPPLRIIRWSIVRLFIKLILCFPWSEKHFVTHGVIKSFAQTPICRFTELARMMFDWAFRRRLPEESDAVIFGKPTLHIHGTNDWLLPIRLTTPDIRIQGAGHTPVLSHPVEVNEMIERFCEEIFRENSSSAMSTQQRQQSL
jgi:pimeloyl-ACP methyl ester carboxylesterase